MATGIRTVRVGAVLLSMGLPLSACQSYLPRDETPVVPPPLASAPNSGPSSQRLDANGYPMIGAYPTAATAQVSDETVAETRDRYARVEARGNGTSDAAYRRRVAELQALAARQQADAAAALQPAPDAASSRAQ